MWLIRMAWKNLWRNHIRTFITMAAIFFAVILSIVAVSLKDGVFNNLVKNVVSFYTGYLQVHKQGYWNEQILDNGFKKITALENEICSNKNISDITSRLESFVLLSSKELTKGSLLVGIEPEKENNITLLQKKIISGKYLESKDQAIIIAQGLAERLQVKIFDTLVLIGQGYHGSTATGKYYIKGIVKFGSPELNEKIAFMPLQLAQQFFDAENLITSYVVSLNKSKELETTAKKLAIKLGNGYEVMSWGDMIPEIKQHIETDTANMKYVQGFLYLLIGFGIFGTQLMMMIERKYEIGMLVAIGMKKSKLMILFLLETTFTVLAGCIGGIMAAIPIIYYLYKNPLKMGGNGAKAYSKFGFEPIFPASIEASNFISQTLMVLMIGLALSLYAMYKIIVLNPVIAMKR